MEGIILDTNVLSELMRPQPDRSVMDWFAERTAACFHVTAITQAEILLGIALLPEGKRKNELTVAAKAMFSEDFAGRCLPFDEGSAEHYARVVSIRRRSGRAITTEDAQTASIALSRRCALATRNTKDFLHIDGLTLHNPWQTE